MYVFRMVLTINSHCFPMCHSSVDLSNVSTLFCGGNHLILVYGGLNHGTAQSISVFACHFHSISATFSSSP